MPPTNTTIGTAQVLPSLPVSFTVDVQDGTTAAEVWYAYTAQAGDTIIGFSGVAWYYVPGSDPQVVMGYSPRMTMYSLVGGVPAQSEYPPVAFPVTAGETYWLRVWNSLGGTTNDAQLIFSGTNAPSSDPEIPDPGVEEPYSGTAIDVGTLPVDISLDVGADFIYPLTFWFRVHRDRCRYCLYWCVAAFCRTDRLRRLRVVCR